MTHANEPEIEKYYEKDIIEFLDKKATGDGEQTEITELENALKEKNTDKANKILRELIEKYNRTSSNDVYKEIYLNRIRELIKKSKTYLKENKELNKLKESIDLIEKSQQLKSGMIDNITVFEEQEKQQQQEKKQKEIQEEDTANKLNKEMKRINTHIFVAIRKQDLKKAMMYYKEFKKRFEQYPSRLIDDKKELYNDLLALYMSIQKLKKQLIKNKEIQNKQQNKEQEQEEKEHKKKTLKIEEVKKQIQTIQEEIKKQEYKKAKSNILDLKHKISLIPNKHNHIKSGLEDIANSLTKKLEFSKKINQEPKKEGERDEIKTSN